MNFENLAVACVDFEACENSGIMCALCADHETEERVEQDKSASLFARLMQEYDAEMRREKETEWDF